MFEVNLLKIVILNIIFLTSAAICIVKKTAQETFTCSKSTVETLEKGMKYVQS